MSIANEELFSSTDAKENTELAQLLQKVVDKNAEIALQYGGFKITVTHPRRFPWDDVFSLLRDESFDVWLTKKDNVLSINARYRPP